MQGSSPNLTQLQAAVGILAQLVPAAAVETALWIVPSTHRTFVSELAVCNLVGAPGSFRFSISIRGAATQPKDYLYYNLPISGNDTFASEIGVTLNAGDTIRVTTLTGNLSFTLFGMSV